MYKLYILYNQSVDKYYVGITQDLAERIRQHNLGGPSTKFTRKYLGSWEVVYIEDYETLSAAKVRENRIKRMKSRKYLEGLIKGLG
jgi:putative endonuclease